MRRLAARTEVAPPSRGGEHCPHCNLALTDEWIKAAHSRVAGRRGGRPFVLRGCPFCRERVWCPRVARSHSAMPAEPGAAQYSVEVSAWPLIRRSDYRAYGYQVSNRGVNWRVVRSSPTWGAKHFKHLQARSFPTPTPKTNTVWGLLWGCCFTTLSKTSVSLLVRPGRFLVGTTRDAIDSGRASPSLRSIVTAEQSLVACVQYGKNTASGLHFQSGFQHREYLGSYPPAERGERERAERIDHRAAA